MSVAISWANKMQLAIMALWSVFQYPVITFTMHMQMYVHTTILKIFSLCKNRYKVARAVSMTTKMMIK